MGAVGRSDALVTCPCLEVDIFSKEVNFCPIVTKKKKVGNLP